MGFESAGKTFADAFNEGFDRTFKTKDEKEAIARKKKLEQLEIDDKQLQVDMKKTAQKQKRAVEEVVQSGFDPNVVAKTMSDYHPNDIHYKYEGKDKDGNYQFAAGKYLKNDEGDYEVDDNGNRIFEPAIENGERVATVFEPEKYKTEVAMRLQPAAWMDHHLKEAARIEQRRFELEKQDRGFEQRDKEQDKGIGFKTEDREDKQGFEKAEKAKDRASAEKIAGIKADATKSKSDKEKAPYTTFTTGTGKDQIQHKVSKGDMEKYKSEAKAMNEKLGGEAQIVERDMFILERLKGQKWWRDAVKEFRKTGNNPEAITSRLESYGMDAQTAQALANSIGGGEVDDEGGGVFSSISKWLF